MRGLMMDYQLTLQQVLERSNRLFAKKCVITRQADGSLESAAYGDIYRRVHRLAGALHALGIDPGDRVATLAWNTQRHLEAYLAAPCMGAVLHTVNFRLFPDQIAYIMNHAEDEVVLVDPSVIPLLEPLREKLNTIKHVVVMGDLPDGVTRVIGRPTHRYEDLLAAAPDEYPFPRLDEETAAAMCYTSGTTGNPKGVLYSHRAIMLHTLTEAMPDVMALSERDVVLSVVPMFHVNSWGVPFTSTLVGATQVMPGPAPTPADLAALIESQRVSMATGVPTVWLGVLAAQQSSQRSFSSLERIICGGSAAPRSLIEAYQRQFSVPIWHAWGMTEMTPLGSVCHLKTYLTEEDDETQWSHRVTQGLPSPFVDMKAIDESGSEVPRDGKSLGELVVRGPWVTAGYFLDETSTERFTDEGWFRTGDIVTINEEGYLQIADRTKDLVKSGGEWISSVDLENALMAHPGVAEAAVIAIPDEKWGERPLACVVRKPEAQSLSGTALIDHLRPNFARWWLPDRVEFIDEVPKTSVGKFDKKVLRERYH
ncbi:MAG: long-chain fatty acid--CoA ligase [Chloroflexota bacterium]